jgi:hypothetical protein
MSNQLHLPLDHKTVDVFFFLQASEEAGYNYLILSKINASINIF